MTFSNKQIFRIAVLYGLIVGFSNVCGVLIPGLLQSPGVRFAYMDEWIQFLNDYKLIIGPLEYITYIIPAILCLIYPFATKTNREKRLINLPIAYATIGLSGWITYVIEESILLPIATHLGYSLDTHKIFTTSCMYIILEATCSFTLSFFISDLIHKKVFFPKYYPIGEFLNVKGVKHPSLKFLFIINYISVTFFPITFLFIAFLSVLQNNNLTMDKNVIIMLMIILSVGWIITISFLMSVQKPMKLLKERIKKLQDGDLESKVIVMSNDDFGELSDIFNSMTKTIALRNRKIEEIQNSVIESMAIAVEGKDSNTGGHIMRTSQCVKVFVERLKSYDVYNKIPDSFYNAVIVAAPMHDLGKLYVDDRVLKKNGKFTDEEYELMKMHPAEGAKVVADILKKHDNEELKKIAENVAHFHHEKWNGQGYPDKLKEAEIPLEARIMALADVFDALVSKRCYKDSFGFDKSFQIIEESLGSHFDPELGKIFISCRPELEKLYSEI